MAEEIKLGVEADNKAIFVYDVTGVYNKKGNPGGWGTPNIAVSDIISATVEFFPPEAETGILIDVSSAFPNIDGTGFEVLAEDLGLTEIPSGVWRFVYRTVSNDPTNLEEIVSVSKYFDTLIACCVDTLSLDFSTSNLLSESNKNIVEMEMLLENARRAACKGDLVGAQTIANYINLRCNCCK